MTDLEIDRDDLAALAKGWWLPVVVGVLLMIYAFVVLSFSIQTVYAISVGLGVGLLIAGIGELLLWRSVQRWRWLVLVAGIVDIALGITAFVWPGATFLVLARLVGWVLLFRGIIEIVRSLDAHSERQEGWWIFLVIGVIDIAVALWASRYPGRSVTLLVLWVGISLISRGLIAIVSGFALRSAGKALAKG